MGNALPTGGMQDWFRAATRNNAEYSRVATNPTLVGIVSPRIRGNGFTNQIPVMCSDHETGYSVRLSIEEGELQIGIFAKVGQAPVDAQKPQMLASEKGQRLRAVCGECGKTFSDVNPVNLLKNAVTAIALMATRRPALRF